MPVQLAATKQFDILLTHRGHSRRCEVGPYPEGYSLKAAISEMLKSNSEEEFIEVLDGFNDDATSITIYGNQGMQLDYSWIEVSMTKERMIDIIESVQEDIRLEWNHRDDDLDLVLAELKKPILTVREVFSGAFAPVPEGATCHIGYERDHEGSTLAPTLVTEGIVITYWNDSPVGCWKEDLGFQLDAACGPDISDRPAEAFRGFFGPAYDAVLDGKK